MGQGGASTVFALPPPRKAMLIRVTASLRAAMLLTMAASAACSSPGSAAEEWPVDSAGRRDSVAGVVAGSLDESQVIGLLEQTYAADSALGARGAASGSTLIIKDFGRMITREQHALRRDAVSLATELGIQPAAPRTEPDMPPQTMLDMLASGAPSASWDRAYLDYAIALYQSSMENTARALAATNRAEIRQLISRSVPILQKHLDKATSLRKQIADVRDPEPADTKRR